MGLRVAFKAFFKGLFDSKAAQRIDAALRETPSAVDETARPALPHLPAPTPAPTAAPALGSRPDPGMALVLLAELQREGRLLDFLSENLDGADDAMVGVAVREVHRGCKEALKRYFEVEPLRREAEGESIQVTPGYDPAELRLIGTAGQPPFAGTLRHRGWRVVKVNVPTLLGDAAQRMIVAPAQVEAS